MLIRVNKGNSSDKTFKMINPLSHRITPVFLYRVCMMFIFRKRLSCYVSLQLISIHLHHICLCIPFTNSHCITCSSCSSRASACRLCS
uniref:Uncharacterized protein n=1 Tax=Arundo donax TaxID=35708 RepID=A0A0A9F048_ARUDO